MCRVVRGLLMGVMTPRRGFPFTKEKGKVEWEEGLCEGALGEEGTLILGYKVSK